MSHLIGLKCATKDAGGAAVNSSPVRLKVLLRQRHWQSHATFCAEYDKAASVIDPGPAGSYPSRAQLHRWLSGTVQGMPLPHHCRVLEAMFPDWTIGQLFQPVDSDPADSPALRAQAGLARKDIGQLLGMVETGFREPDSSPPAWGLPVRSISGQAEARRPWRARSATTPAVRTAPSPGRWARSSWS